MRVQGKHQLGHVDTDDDGSENTSAIPRNSLADLLTMFVSGVSSIPFQLETPSRTAIDVGYQRGLQSGSLCFDKIKMQHALH